MTFLEGVKLLVLGPLEGYYDRMTTLLYRLTGDHTAALVLFVLLSVLLALPVLSGLLHRRGQIAGLNSRQRRTDRYNRGLLLFCQLYLAILTGVLIPSEVLKASPAEFVDLSAYQSPLRYLWSSGLLAAGAFLLWGMLYGLFLTPQARKWFVIGLAALSADAAVNYMFFGRSYGIISSELRYETAVTNPVLPVILNLLLLPALAAGAWLLWKKGRTVLRLLCLYGSMALAVLSVVNISTVSRQAAALEQASQNEASQKTAFRLSKTGRNVVVIMLDRAIGGFVPFLLQEKPELASQFDGFTWYPNTLSYGYHTNIAAPALFGGYEYTPEGLEARDTLLLREKHNEALKIMPLNFLRAGYDVTVCDAPYANYQWIPDLSIYDEYPEIRKFRSIGLFDEDPDRRRQVQDHLRNRNLFSYSLFRCAPLLLQPAFYDGGNYLEREGAAPAEADPLAGVSTDFLSSWRTLGNLAAMTEVSEEITPGFLMLTNETTHNPIALQLPDYVPASSVDNTAWEADHGIRTAADGRTLDLREASELVTIHYHANMAAFLQLGKWFDQLRGWGVWDNTRIILVSDHGCYLGLFGANLLEGKASVPEASRYEASQWSDTMCYNPLLMVKDFDAKEFTENPAFMTNADTPLLAFADTVSSPVNPFTGHPVTDEAKRAPVQHLVESSWTVEENNGAFFSDPLWITFQGENVFDSAAWSLGR